jgi:hypothetical protein
MVRQVCMEGIPQAGQIWGGGYWEAPGKHHSEEVIRCQHSDKFVYGGQYETILCTPVSELVNIVNIAAEPGLVRH